MNMRNLAGIVCTMSLLATGASWGAGAPVEWGMNLAGRSGVMAVVTNAVSVSCNSDWSLLLTDDGTLLAWGSNRFQQTNVPAGANFVHSFAGWHHGIACKSDGTVDEWGTPYAAADEGQALMAWEASRPAMANAIQVAAGDDHSAALLADGTVRIWGGRDLVTRHDGRYTDIKQIASTWYALLMLRADGTVVAVGENSQVDGYITPPPGLSNVTAIACSQFGMYAIRSDGSGIGWGMPNTYGQFTFPPNATNLVSIAGGRYHTIAARADGSTLAWGANDLGQLDVPPGLKNVRIVAGGRYHSLVVGRLMPASPGWLRIQSQND